MVSAWVEHIRDFAKRNNLTYGCALSDPNCSKEYHAKKPSKLNKKEKKEVESMGAEDINVVSPYSYKKAKELEGKRKGIKEKIQSLQSRKNKKAVENQLVETMGMAGEDTMIRNIPAPPQKENIQMVISEVKKKGRPFKYTPEEALKMKKLKTLESNRRKRGEKKAAKTTGGMLPAGTGVGSSRVLPAPQEVLPTIEDQIERNTRLIAQHAERKAKKNEPKERADTMAEFKKISDTQKAFEKNRKNQEKALRGKGILDPKNLDYTKKFKRGTGLVAGYTTENHNGLAHIYPVSHDHVLKMLAHYV